MTDFNEKYYYRATNYIVVFFLKKGYLFGLKDLKKTSISKEAFKAGLTI